jgi:very-short-patch-repair endonuclease
VLPIDALALAEKYPGLRGIRRARTALALMDSGSESPKETWLRLVLIDGGFGRPRTQIRLSDGVKEAFIDMGYDEPKVGFDYDGWHHSENRDQYVHDIGRAEFVEREGWLDIRVVAEIVGASSCTEHARLSPDAVGCRPLLHEGRDSRGSTALVQKSAWRRHPSDRR